jgi:hypothetical protein
MADAPVIIAYDFQSIETEIIVSGQHVDSLGLVQGMEKFDYSATVNRTKFYGRSRQPLARTEGDAEYDASIDIHRYWFHYLRGKAKEFGIPLADLEMVINHVYYGKLPGQNDVELHSDTLTGVKFKTIKNSGSHGADPIQTEMPLDVMNIFWDGEDLFGNKL